MSQTDIKEDISSKERIAKYVSRAGGPSRRETERLILDGKVFVNNKKVTTPAFFVSSEDIIQVGKKIIDQPQASSLWAFHKPIGCITSDHDPEGRETIFNYLPKDMPRIMTIGRLDYNSEGLLLLTNDGSLKRKFELPSSNIMRHYRVRAFGTITQKELDNLKNGIVIDRIAYAPIEATLERVKGSNNWINITLTEGKNREIRKILEFIGLKVNRLIRTEYGAFALDALPPKMVQPIDSSLLKKAFQIMNFK